MSLDRSMLGNINNGQFGAGIEAKSVFIRSKATEKFNRPEKDPQRIQPKRHGKAELGFFTNKNLTKRTYGTTRE